MGFLPGCMTGCSYAEVEFLPSLRVTAPPLIQNDLGRRHIPEPNSSSGKKVIVIQNRVTILKADHTVLLLSFLAKWLWFSFSCAQSGNQRVFRWIRANKN